MKVVQIKEENVKKNLKIATNEYDVLFEGSYSECIEEVMKLGKEDTAFMPPSVINGPNRILFGFQKGQNWISVIM